MTTSSPTQLPLAQREALEARVAQRLCARLDDGAQQLPHDITERLRVARERALAASREARLAATAPQLAPVSVAVATSGVRVAGAANGLELPFHLPTWLRLKTPHAKAHRPPKVDEPDDKPLSWGWRLALVAPVAALLLGLWGIQRYQHHEQVQAATTIDMKLLIDELPLDAYADPGYQAYLNMPDNDPDVSELVNAPIEISGDLVNAETLPMVNTPDHGRTP